MRSFARPGTVSVKNAAKLQAMRAAGRLASECLAWILGQVQPGMSTLEIDDLQMQFGYTLSGDEGRGPSLLDDDQMIGLSDAGAHLTLLADHAYTSYFLGRWVRERKLMPLEQAVRKLTQVPAQFFGIPERGELREGWCADVVLFDPERINAREPELVSDLPGGSSRLITRADGIEAVIVNGGVAVQDGELTGLRRGHVIRGA